VTCQYERRLSARQLAKGKKPPVLVSKGRILLQSGYLLRAIRKIQANYPIELIKFCMTGAGFFKKENIDLDIDLTNDIEN
jgi:hypothetical protein